MGKKTDRLKAKAKRFKAKAKHLKDQLHQAGKQIAHLERIADEDPLVAVLNRRAFMRELERVLAYIERYKCKASLVFIDLDDFKLINDKYGHVTGDMALQHIGDLLSANVRRSDVAGRLGGDEFGLIVNQAGFDEASRIAEKLCALILNTPFVLNGVEVTISGSAGVAEMNPAINVQEVIERADRAMYARKEAHTPK